MGRHSAPDDDLDDDAEGASSVAIASIAGVVPEVPIRRGRHSRDEEDEPRSVAMDETARIAAIRVAPDDRLPFVDEVLHADTTEIAPIDPESTAIAPVDPDTTEIARIDADAEGGADSGAEPARAPSSARDRFGGSAADLRLIRDHADVRARCLAAAIVPFAIYVAVFAVIGKLDVHMLLWIWIPLITAGVLVGAFLDAGHRRHGAA